MNDAINLFRYSKPDPQGWSQWEYDEDDKWSMAKRFPNDKNKQCIFTYEKPIKCPRTKEGKDCELTIYTVDNQEFL